MTHARIKPFALFAALDLVVSACSDGSGSGSDAPEGSGDGGAGGYPEGAITFVVPFAAGGPTDTVTRLIAEPMSATLGQQIVVQNVDGRRRHAGRGRGRGRRADGYTVLMHHIGMSTAPTLYPDLAYNPLEDFKMIGLVTEVPMTIIAGSEFEPNDARVAGRLREGERGTVNYANAGIGAASHLCGLLFRGRPGPR